jgi:glucose-1-phosphate adenylyltransferase
MPLPEVLWISVQYNPASLTRHLSNGRPWDLDRTTGGGVVVGPDARVGGGSEGEVALVGRAVELSAGTVVPPGGRLPEED